MRAVGTLTSVHPRACGERAVVVGPPKPHIRFIPAPAGNGIRPKIAADHVGAVHPRACGERAVVSVVSPHADGSSPRLRGTGSWIDLDPGRRSRFIPAPAGNGPWTSRRACGTAVHPRACGERLRRGDPGGFQDGSSPRLRGTGRSGLARHAKLRFIPAPAGNGVDYVFVLVYCPVHPRACGERSTTVRFPFTSIGSSPRLRGTGMAFKDTYPKRRFIPAPAGNGAKEIVSLSGSPVHPRACGERLRVEKRVRHDDGSSPRLRGTAASSRRWLRNKRFIPAPAGNGSVGRSGTVTHTVHPRACGERTRTH